MSTETVESDLRRTLKARMRTDLAANQQRHAGQLFYILKDPVSLRYYRFRPEEYFILQQLDGTKDLYDVQHAFVAEFSPQRLSIEDLERFVRQLLDAGVAVVDSRLAGRRLYERHKERKFVKLKQTLLNFMYIRIPLFDPERLLDRLLGWFGFLFTIPFFLVACAFWASAGLLILCNWDQFLAKLPTFEDFFKAQNIFWLWCSIGVVKVLHEFGHGISCKKFGGEVHEMGFMLLVFSPALYCNVTDAWMLPNRWHRAIIGAAGIYVELIIAAAAAWVWWFSEPGMLNFLCLSTIVVCSVSTVVFNGNPLMKFDGYYIVSDLLEIPNLRERSNRYLGNLASRALFGVEASPDSYAPGGRRWPFAIYAVAAYVYKWVVAVGIIFFFYTFLKPYKLEIIGIMLAWFAFGSMVVFPIFQVNKVLRRQWREMKVKTARMVFGLTTAGVALTTLLLMPFPLRVNLPMLVQARDAASLYVHSSGRLVELRVKDGDVVSPGTIIAILENPDTAREEAKLELEAAMQLRRQEVSKRVGDHVSAQAATVQWQAVRERIKHLDGERRKLTIRVPSGVSGRVMGPPKETELGKWYDAGRLLCKVGSVEDLEGYAVVEHGDTSLFKVGNRAWVKVRGHLGAVNETSIERVSETVVDDLPPALSSKAGGAIPTNPENPSARTSAAKNQDRPPETPTMRSYSVAVRLDNTDRRLAPGLRGTVRVDCGSAPLAWRIARYLQQTFYFKI
jgi:putative peptide zinc metalloprotease protein